MARAERYRPQGVRALGRMMSMMMMMMSQEFKCSHGLTGTRYDDM